MLAWGRIARHGAKIRHDVPRWSTKKDTRARAVKCSTRRLSLACQKRRTPKSVWFVFAIAGERLTMFRVAFNRREASSATLDPVRWTGLCWPVLSLLVPAWSTALEPLCFGLVRADTTASSGQETNHSPFRGYGPFKGRLWGTILCVRREFYTLFFTRCLTLSLCVDE